MNETMTTPGVAANHRRRGIPVPKGGRVASRVAACVLEVLAGVRTPAVAAGELGTAGGRAGEPGVQAGPGERGRRQEAAATERTRSGGGAASAAPGRGRDRRAGR
jgi:hypothetical protein